LNLSINCILKYTFNFKPKLFNINSLNSSINSKLYCKNFIYFMLFVEYFLKKNSLKNYKICIFKRNKSCQSVLRAPNKYKKAQVHLKIERFFFSKV